MARATPATVKAFLLEELTGLPAPLTGKQLEAELRDVQKLLERSKWTFAKTMPQNPHWYTLARDWENLNAFYYAVEFIRRHGIWTEYKGWPYIELHVGGFFYWTMGYPVEETTLINRKPR